MNESPTFARRKRASVAILLLLSTVVLVMTASRCSVKMWSPRDLVLSCWRILVASFVPTSQEEGHYDFFSGNKNTIRDKNKKQPQQPQHPLKIFLLAGQSNMVGMGSLKHLDLLVQQNDNNEYRQTLWNGTGYKQRDDVYMIYETHYGPLAVGRQYAGKDSFGPELMFGWTLGDALKEEQNDSNVDTISTAPILLLKTAWGGRNLAIDFRPPSAGTGQYGDHPSHYGWEYRTMIAAIHDTLDNLSSYAIPGFSAAAGYSLEGFVWFQGWNDMLDMRKVQEYGPNLAHFIRDVRLDLDAPDLPFVIGELGMHGEHPYGRGTDRILGLRAAQHSVTLLPEFVNTTFFVRTAPYAVLNETNYNGIYHYNGRADTYFHMGQAFGRGMLTLMNMKERNNNRPFIRNNAPLT